MSWVLAKLLTEATEASRGLTKLYEDQIFYTYLAQPSMAPSMKPRIFPPCFCLVIL